MKLCLVTAATATDFEDADDAGDSGVREYAASPHLGILTLASVLDQRGTRPFVVNLNREYYAYLQGEDSCGVKAFASWVAHVIVSSEADVYGFSSICSSYPLTIRIAECVKQARPGCTIVFGGPQASVVDLPTLAKFPFVDFVLRGEADLTLPLFLDEWSGQRRFQTIPGLTYRTPFGPLRNGDAPIIEDLDSLPLPAFHLSGGLEGVPAAPLELGRGCPFACTFCSTNDFFRRKFRVKSPQRMLADMRAVAAEYGYRKFDLAHDMFTVDRRRVVAFCHHMIESGERFTWSCSARTDCVDDELLELMARAGCDGMFFGVETGSTRMQKIIDKNLDPERAKVVIETAERLGIPTTVSLISGFPEETWDDLRETVGMYMHSLRHVRSSPQFNLLAPLAETPVHAKYKDQLVLDDLCSDMSHQGRFQNDADRALVHQYPEIFPNFYLLPMPGLDRGCLLEFREFLLMAPVRLRWLLTALDQSGSGILDVFVAWRRHRSNIRPDLSGGSLRHYYTRDVARNEFVRFVRSRLAEFENPGVEALLAYHEAAIEAEACDAQLPREGQPVAGPIMPTDRPIRKRHLEVIELDWDIQSVIDSLKRAERPADTRTSKVYRTRGEPEGNSRLIEITALLAVTLQDCDGRRSVEEVITELSSHFSCSEELRRYAGECLLEEVHGEGLVEIYRIPPLAKQELSAV